MPKALPATFWNHNARPAVARQLQMSNLCRGRSIMLYISTDVFVNPPVQVGRADNIEFYPMDFDDTNLADGTGMDNNQLDDPADDRPTVIAGTGVIVMPPAKRYHNSVRFCTCIFFIKFKI
jgi:hypothetical protein